MRKSALVLFFVLLTAGCSSVSPDASEFTAIELGPTQSSVATDDQDLDNSPESVSDAFAELELEDQVGDGTQVKVDEVRLSLGQSFLAISNLSGDLLGYAIATPDSQPVVVQLDVRLMVSQELIGTLYLDNGDGLFSLESDVPIRDDDGEIVSEDFDYSVKQG